MLVKSYPCIIGANGTNKKKAGDHATPKGSYFTLRYTPGSALQEIYGEGAFVLNYPNFLDRKEQQERRGIWIHGHVPGKVIGAGDLVNTKGCIAVSNDIIRELKNLLHPSGDHRFHRRQGHIRQREQPEGIASGDPHISWMPGGRRGRAATRGNI